jgi:hypothetical protein
MPKRKAPELDPAEQYERFKKAAKAAGLTDDEKDFEKAFKKTVPPKKRTKDGLKRRR